jgi:hypothetical protein
MAVRLPRPFDAISNGPHGCKVRRRVPKKQTWVRQSQLSMPNQDTAPACQNAIARVPDPSGRRTGERRVSCPRFTTTTTTTFIRISGLAGWSKPLCKGIREHHIDRYETRILITYDHFVLCVFDDVCPIYSYTSSEFQQKLE